MNWIKTSEKVKLKISICTSSLVLGLATSSLRDYDRSHTVAIPDKTILNLTTDNPAAGDKTKLNPEDKFNLNFLKIITMKNILITVTLLATFFFSVNGQTTVSGGIYSNTTWTLANSPYTADTVVVFPNVTLTIEPGVVVIVNGNLEIRQATLIAEGTATDSITFIGNLPIAPWGDTLYSAIINFNNALSSKMNFCNVKDIALGNFVSFGIKAQMNSSTDSITIRNSYFSNNGVGIQMTNSVLDSCVFRGNIIAAEQSYGTITNSIFRMNQTALSGLASTIIRNCVIDSNSVLGIDVMEGGYGSLIENCQIRNNEIGLMFESNFSSGIHNQIHYNIIEENNIGIKIRSSASPDSISCNKICNNTTYNLLVSSSYNRIAAYNYWCTNDSLTIANSIFDGYDSSSLGLLNFMPIDTSGCYLTSGIATPVTQSISFSIFPNPASDYLTIELPKNVSKADFKIYNALGELAYESTTKKQSTTINISTFKGGMYFIQISTIEGSSRLKFTKE